MSVPYDLTLELDTGLFLLSEGKIASREVTRTEGKLTDAALGAVRDAARTALRRGLETVACRRERARGLLILPIMDAIVSMTVELDGESDSASIRPDRWSKESQTLQEIADRAVHEIERPGRS